jgi:sec-independent protein translocase protein TatB
MFDVSWSELLVVAVVAIVVVGPKELPKMLRTFGQFSRQARKMASEFKAGLAELAAEAELDEVKKSIHHVSNFDPSTRPEPFIDPAAPTPPSPEPEQPAEPPKDRPSEP